MLNNVQALRALAAMMVVVGHLQALFVQVHPALNWVGLGRAGVDLFFVISGFIMVYTTERSQPSPLGFALRRVIRIVPVYWLVTLGVFALALVAPGLLGASRPDPVWLAKSMAFIPFDKGDGTFNPLVPVGWTLNYEMFFYAVFALTLFLPIGRARYLVAAGLIGALSFPGFWTDFPGVAAQFYTRPILAEFSLGIILGLLFDKLPRARSEAAAGLSKAGLVLALIALVTSGLAQTEAMRVLVAGPAALAILALALMLERGEHATDNRAALVLGEASYAIYLTHMFVTQAFIIGAAMLGVRSPGLSLAVIALALVAVMVGGIVMTWIIERPVDKALRRSLLGREPTRPTATYPGT